MACRLSRDIMDFENVAVGANFPIPRAAVLLAYYSHAPNLRMGMGSFYVNLQDVSRAATLRFFTDYRPVRWAESAALFPVDLFCFHKLDAFFISGIQIDRYGNTNLIGIRGKENPFKFRGPGSIGTTTLAAAAKRYYIVSESHTSRVFVKNCDYISAMGFGRSGRNEREELHLPGGGPKLCLTPLGVFDFNPETYEMRVHSINPGVSKDEIIENTGFPMEIPEKPTETEPPTDEELRILREKVDVEGVLRS